MDIFPCFFYHLSLHSAGVLQTHRLGWHDPIKGIWNFLRRKYFFIVFSDRVNALVVPLLFPGLPVGVIGVPDQAL